MPPLDLTVPLVKSAITTSPQLQQSEETQNENENCDNSQLLSDYPQQSFIGNYYQHQPGYMYQVLNFLNKFKINKKYVMNIKKLILAAKFWFFFS